MKTSPDFDWNSSFFSDYQNYFQKAYQLQTDLEEAKRQEILKLQYSMQAIQAKVDETNALLTKEREFAHIRIAHQVAHFQLIQNAREKGALQEAKDKLQAQVEDLTLHLELEKRLKTDLEEAKGHEILELQNSLQAMLAKVNVTNALLTMDRESAQKKNGKLSVQVEELKSLLELERNRKQCESSEIKPDQLLVSMNRLEEKLTNIESENKVLRQQVLAMAAQLKSILDLHSPLMHLRDADVEKRPQKSLSEKQQEYDEDWLIRCITQHLGFSKGRPIAACVIYKCLSQWRSFDIKETNIFDLITKTIGQAIKTQYKNNEVLAYWLSNVSTLLLLLRHEQDEVFFHALMFKEKLTEYAQKIYGMIRDSLKKEILPLLKLCIQAPIDFGPELLNRTDASPDILIAHWQAIVNNFDCFLNILKSNNVPPFFVRKIFTQNFSFINAMLFSSLVWRVESCSISNSEYVKAGLSKLEHWCYKASEEYAGSAWDELKDIRQAVVLLVLDQNPKKTLDKMIHEISFCPIVIPILRMLFEEDCSYFPDERSSIPLSVYDISKSIESMDEINIEDVEPPPLICEIFPKSLWPSGIKSVGKRGSSPGQIC